MLEGEMAIIGSFFAEPKVTATDQTVKCVLIERLLLL